MIVDVNCYCGHWPFRRIKNETLEGLLKSSEKTGIDKMIVSSLNSIFYEDCYEGDAQIYEAASGKFFQALTVNPAFPTFADDIRRGIEAFSIKAVRIFPGYHNYELDDPCVKELFEILAKYKLPLLLTYQMEDRRTIHMCMPKQLENDKLLHMLQFNEKIPVVITNMHVGQWIPFSKYCEQYGNVYFDTSGIRYGQTDIITKALEIIPDNNILYGSNFPLNYRTSTLNYFRMDPIEFTARENILYKNAQRLFGI